MSESELKNTDENLKPNASYEQILNSTQLDKLIINAKDFCLLNGLVMFDQIKDAIDMTKSFRVVHSPITLLPSYIPRDEYNYAIQLQNSFNELIYKISLDYEFLKNAYSNIIKIDDFSQRLFNIYETVRNEGINQPISLNIMRNDYILDLNKKNTNGKILTMLSQIEYNTISCASGAASTRMKNLHSYILRIAGKSDLIEKQAPNNCLDGLATGLIKGWQFYGNENAYLVFLVRKNEVNIGDQRILELKCLELEPRIKIERLTFDELVNEASIDNQKRLFINGQEIALVYYRSGYDPVDYPTDKEWNLRLMIERSCAIKCPTIHYQLAGAKRIQQALFETNVIEKYISDSDICAKIRATFVDQRSFGKGEQIDKQTIELMKQNFNDYVLKPQREGGGNKFFGLEIKNFIDSHDESSLLGYVLMRLVNGVVNENYLLRPGHNLIKEKLISEIGIFGVLIGNCEQILHNDTVGYLLRSKLSTAKEGGVGIGTAVLDSIILS